MAEKRMAHLCQAEHTPIRHNGSGDDERCPLCRALAELAEARRRRVQALRLIAATYCDELGNPVREIPDVVDKISDVLLGLDAGAPQ